MQSNHTSGPWMAEKHPLGHYGVFQRDHAHQVAEVFDRNTSPEMVTANADLIAAAPETLEALQILLGCIIMGGDPYEGLGPMQPGTSPISKAKAAVRKACLVQNSVISKPEE